jgi:hypothetical protein
MVDHACDRELVRTIHYAVTYTSAEYTAFVLFRCKCGRSGVFPEANDRATTAEFRQEFESALAAQRAWIELVGAEAASITASAPALQAKAGTIVVKIDDHRKQAFPQYHG